MNLVVRSGTPRPRHRGSGGADGLPRASALGRCPQCRGSFGVVRRL